MLVLEIAVVYPERVRGAGVVVDGGRCLKRPGAHRENIYGEEDEQPNRYQGQMFVNSALPHDHPDGPALLRK